VRPSKPTPSASQRPHAPRLLDDTALATVIGGVTGDSSLLRGNNTDDRKGGRY
jgi:hypothetical protein